MACRSPYLIDARRKLYKPDMYGLKNGIAPDYAPTMFARAVVPCGKCVECLKRRQNTLAARCASEANKKGSMQFLTLTYNDESLPIAMRIEQIDKESGEILYNTKFEVLDREIYKVAYEAESIRCALLSKKASSSPRLFSKTVFEDEKQITNYIFTPSLNREDFRLWLKSARVAYKRHFGVPLPDFTYACVGEYGSKSCRPHYHVAFFGLSFLQVQWLESRWNYGFTYLENVKAVNKDGTSGFNFVARYIGKYLVKGKFDCRSVIDGLSEKGRLCCSKSLGFELDAEGNLSESLLSWYRCYDLFGKYDPDTLILENDKKLLTNEQCNRILSEARKRNSVSISGAYFPLPQSVVRKIWYVRTPAFVRPSKLRAMAQKAVLDGYMDTVYGKLRQRIMDKDAKDMVASSLPFSALLSSASLASESAAEISFLNYYSKSIF